MKQSVYIIQCPPSWLKTPPLSLVYLKNYLQYNSFTVGIKDLNTGLFDLLDMATKEWLTLNQDFENTLFRKVEEKFPHLLENLYKEIEKFDFVGFSILKRNTPFSFSLAEEIKKQFPEKKIIFGGPQALSLDWQGKLDARYTWVAGEGEIPLSKILSGEKNTLYRFEEIENLDTLPFLDFKPLSPMACAQTIPLLSSRGCPYKCNFCSEKNLYKKFRHHSVQYMFEQIKYLKDRHKTNNFVFCDSLINYDNQWLSEFCTLLIENNLKIKWEAQMRITRNFPLELGRLMKKSGCYNLFIGLESASDDVLAAMNKGFTQRTALSFLEMLHKAELQFEISLIFGYPAESDENFKETLDFIVKNKKIIPKIAQANPFVDYLCGFPENIFPNEIAKERIKIFLKNIENEKIKYTKSFIGNLIYE